ncbi:hypothetical protein GCM10010174_50770 [Kutzneria viridogrisea]|uniref:Methyltransferase domain-containing protein n=2 Tax=Kutzneria TaxID=43356 RepID=W5WDR1_9PSEU|nr:class I SAM-dependent methyltransferase [Kutzneria albida]AHH99318.1 hypothetical protein KALB_5958 [Kutzneria albida DSM 43870]MBA8923128.1 ubiquinone/menaquinone biosynthesis C-methylase UbiE [Kutzneria viridogrisea]
MLTSYQESVAGAFDRSAESYDAVGVEFFQVFARQLLDDLVVRQGDRVLDVGCGRGAVLFPAAELVGPNGSVTGIDLSEGMVRHTLAEIEGRGLSNVTAQVMDAQRPALPGGAFTAVLASCVVFFLPDPLAGMRAWHDLLAPRGRIGMTTFASGDPRWAAVEQVFAPFVPPSTLWALAAAAQTFGSTESFERAVAAAGFAGINSVVREHPIHFADREQWIRWSWSHGQRMFWELIPESQQRSVREQVLECLRPLCREDGSLVLNQVVRYTVARRD